MATEENTGYLKVQAFSAGGAFPVEGAVVTVQDSEGNSVASLRTDRSGLTTLLSLPAPSATLSQTPENGGTIPYSTYTVRARKDGFYPVEDYFVPIFDGITSIQKVNLIPTTEFSPLGPEARPQIVDTPGYPALMNGGGLTDER